MKLRFYIDIYPGMDPTRYPVFCTQTPGEKADKTVRIAFDVTIPDVLFYHADGHASEVSNIEVLP